MSSNMIMVHTPIAAAVYELGLQHLIHFNEPPVNGVIYGENGRTYTASASRISTTKTKFGRSALYLTYGLSLVTGRTADEAFRTYDFTVECFVNPNDLNGNAGAGYVGIWSMRTGQHNLSLYVSNTGVLSIEQNGKVYSSGVDKLRANEWTHLAYTRQDGTFTLWAKGVSVLTFSDPTYDQPEGAGLTFGQGIYRLNTTSCVYAGYMDEIRVIRGQAMYTEDFVPPTQPFTL